MRTCVSTSALLAATLLLATSGACDFDLDGEVYSQAEPLKTPELGDHTHDRGLAGLDEAWGDHDAIDPLDNEEVSQSTGFAYLGQFHVANQWRWLNHSRGTAEMVSDPARAERLDVWRDTQGRYAVCMPGQYRAGTALCLTMYEVEDRAETDRVITECWPDPSCMNDFVPGRVCPSVCRTEVVGKEPAQKGYMGVRFERIPTSQGGQWRFSSASGRISLASSPAHYLTYITNYHWIDEQLGRRLRVTDQSNVGRSVWRIEPL
jgi:hypothetical protein